MIMKNRTALLLILLLCFAACFALAETSGDYEYELLEDGTAAITAYSGETTEITVPAQLDGIAVTEIRGVGNAERITLSWGVKKIAAYAFSGDTTLKAVSIPDSVTEIGEYAFYGCTNLSEVRLSGQITEIAEGLFSGCKSLTRAGIPESVTVIGKDAFMESGLTEISLPWNLQIIGDGAFYCCESLTQIRIPDKVTVIGEGTFHYDSALTAVTLPAGLARIREYAFAGCSALKEIVIPEGTAAIDGNAFEDCAALEKIVIPESVEEFGDYILWRSGDPVCFVKRNSAAAEYCIRYGMRIRYDAGNSWTAPEDYEIELRSFTAGEISYPDDLLEVAETALERGEAPKAVYKAMMILAKEKGFSPEIDHIMENMAARDSDLTRKLREMAEEGGRALSNANLSWRTGEGTYGLYSSASAEEHSETFLEMIADGRAQFCSEPMLWAEEEFASVLGADFSWFTPSRPRPGYVCVVIRRGAEDQPENVWNAGEDPFGSRVVWNAARTAESLLSQIDERSSDAVPVITGNPNLASFFWVYDMRYPSAENAVWDGEDVRLFDCEVTFTVIDAATHREVAKVTARSEVDLESYDWEWYGDDRIIAYVPELETGTDFRDRLVPEVIRLELLAYSGTDAAKVITRYNTDTVLNANLLQLTVGNSNVWQIAILEDGVQGALLDEENQTLRFRLRGYDPKLEEIGPYAETDNPYRWLNDAIINANQYGLELELPLEGGRLTEEGIRILREEVVKAADAARAAYTGPDMTAALKDWLFPEPLDRDAESPADLLEPSERFLSIAPRFYMAAEEDGISDVQRAILCYAVRNLRVDLSAGPHRVVFSGSGLDAKLIPALADAIFEEQKFQREEERKECWEALNLGAAEAAIRQRQAGYGNEFTITADTDDIAESAMPAECEAYFLSFRMEKTASSLAYRLGTLPAAAAQPFPETGIIAGGRSGTLVRFVISADSKPTYIQMREDETNEIRAALFVMPGHTVEVHVPHGYYRILYCSGDCWYGGEILFGDAGIYQESAAMEILDERYYHTLTLEPVRDGDVGIYGADPSDFQR